MVLRRALDIPDVVRSTNSEKASTFALLGLSPPPTPEQLAQLTPDERVENASAVVEAIVAMGDRGQLDELFAPLSPNPRQRDAIRADVVKAAGDRGHLASLVDVVFTRVVAYAKGPEPQPPDSGD